MTNVVRLNLVNETAVISDTELTSTGSYQTQLFSVAPSSAFYGGLLHNTSAKTIAYFLAATPLTHTTVFTDYTALGTLKYFTGYPGYVIASFIAGSAPLGRTIVKTVGGTTVWDMSRVLQASKPTEEGLQVISFYDDSDQTQQYFGIIDWSSGKILTTFSHGVASPLLTGQNLPAFFESVTPDVYECALLEQRRLITTGGELGAGWTVELGASAFQFDLNANQKQMVSLAGNLIVGGGRMVAFDGFFGRDLGFADFPEQIYSGSDSATGGSMSDGVYNYKIVYEYVDAAGRVYRSTPSAALEVTVNGGGFVQSVVLNVPFPTFYEYPAIANYDNIAPVVVVYRTTNGGTVYYRTGAVATAAGNVTDTESDANLTDNQVLYTEGGYIDNAWPGATSCMAARRDRLFVVPGDDRTAVWYSKPLAEGVGIEFSDGYYVRSETGGDVTGLAVLDDKVIVFKENQIRYFTGDGPNAFGVGEWSPDALITEDVGCIDSRSIVSGQGGVFFQSHKGIYLLDRGLNTVFVGAPVESTTKTAAITAAVVDSKSNRVFFAVDNGGLLVFDQLMGQWCEWTGVTVKAMTLWNDKLTILDHAGVLWFYTEGSYVDNTDGIPLRIETPWYKISSVSGYQRVWEVDLVGRLSPVTGNDLHVDILVDYDDTTIVQTVDVLQSDGHSGDVLARIKPARQKCTAMKFIIRQDATAPDALVSLEGLALVIGVKRGGAKNRAARL